MGRYSSVLLFVAMTECAGEFSQRTLTNTASLKFALSTPTSALGRITDPARWPHQTVGLACRNIGSGRKRAAFWPALGFPNLVLARAAKANKRSLCRLEEWKREELRRTPFALLDDPPDDFRPKKGRK